MEVKAFNAFRFDPEKVGDAGSCISPPYDVINHDQQQRLYEKNEYNIVRLIKGKTSDKDDENNNQYSRACDLLNDWIQKGVLKEDTAEAIYGYVQDFDIAGQSFQRTSFIALAKLEDFGKIVRPHEQILKGPTMDRLNLMRATSCRFGLIFMMYEDEQKIADNIIEQSLKKNPLIDFSDDQNVRHRLFAVTDKQETEAISDMMTGKSCIIADGHHRYTTGLTYAKENPAAKYQMLAFTNTAHPGLIVLATHRVVNNIDDFDCEKFLTVLKQCFIITGFKFDLPDAKLKAKKNLLEAMEIEFDNNKSTFGIYIGNNAFYLAVLSDNNIMASVAADKSKAWQSLDVAVLHKLIIEKILDLDEEKVAQGGNLEYVKDTPNAINDLIAEIDSGKKQIALFMNPPKIQHIQDVADNGERMPQKSTYFYPKVYTGLTINKL